MQVKEGFRRGGADTAVGIVGLGVIGGGMVEAEAEDVDADQVIGRILEAVRVP